MAEFWELTPRETYMAIEAVLWQDKRQQQQMITAAWLTASLSKAKRIPPLKQLLAEPARKLSGEEKQKRRREFDDMSKSLETLDMSKIKPPKRRNK